MSEPVTLKAKTSAGEVTLSLEGNVTFAELRVKALEMLGLTDRQPSDYFIHNEAGVVFDPSSILSTDKLAGATLYLEATAAGGARQSSTDSRLDQPDYLHAREGEIWKPLGLKINILIIAAEDFVVFLDDDLFVQWDAQDETEFDPQFGRIMNQFAILETLSTTHFSNSDSEQDKLAQFRRLLGEAVARILDKEPENADNMLRVAEARLTERSQTRSRIWYMSAATVAFLLATLALGICWLLRASLSLVMGPTAFELLLMALIGCIGGFFFVVIRSGYIATNSSFGMSIHVIEGALRVLTGGVSAFILTLGLKSKLVIGFTDLFSDGSVSHRCLMATLCIVAGMSERVVPEFVRSVEKEVHTALKKGNGDDSSSQT